MLAALNEINMLLIFSTKLVEATPLSARDSWSCANSSFGSNLPAYSTDKICFSLEAVFNYLQTSRIVTFGLITTVLILINSNQPVGVFCITGSVIGPNKPEIEPGLNKVCHYLACSTRLPLRPVSSYGCFRFNKFALIKKTFFYGFCLQPNPSKFEVCGHNRISSFGLFFNVFPLIWMN